MTKRIDLIERLHEYLSILKDVEKEYEGLTIGNIIKQIEARVEHYEGKK